MLCNKYEWNVGNQLAKYTSFWAELILKKNQLIMISSFKAKNKTWKDINHLNIYILFPFAYILTLPWIKFNIDVWPSDYREDDRSSQVLGRLTAL